MEQTCILIASVWEIWGTARGKDLSLPQQTVLTDNSEVFPSSHDTLSVKCTRASERKKRCTLFVVWRWLILLMVPLFLLDPRAYSQPSSQYGPVKTQVGPGHSFACRIWRNSILFKVKAIVLPKVHGAQHFLARWHFLLIYCSSSPVTQTP